MVEQVPARLYDEKNDAVRIDQEQDLDPHGAVAVMSFFRRLGKPHLFHERVRPTLQGGDSSVFLSVRDRPWPPWGLRARTVAAFCQVQAVSPGGVGVSPIYTADEDATNLGLVAAVYAEVLEELTRGERTEINYLVIEGSTYAGRVLRSYGFEPSEDLLVTDEHRYVFHRTEAAALRSRLGFDRVSVPELLAHEVDDETFREHALFFSTLDIGSQVIRLGDRFIREIIWIDGGLFDASLPGGVAPFPAPEAFPGEGQIRGSGGPFQAEAVDVRAVQVTDPSCSGVATPWSSRPSG